MGVLVIDGVPFRHHLDKFGLAEVQHRIGFARAKRKDAFTRLEQAHEKLSYVGIWRERAFLTKDVDIKLDALVRANKKRPFKDRWSLERCLDEAKTLSLYKPDLELVRVRLKSKANGYRIIQRFGPRKKAAQLMASDLLGRYFDAKPYQYTMLGIHAAISAAKALINDGLTYYQHLDIANHFGGFSDERLPFELPLPLEVVEHVVLTKDNALAWDERYAGSHKGLPALHPQTPLGKDALLGLAQGSACSPLVAARCLSRLAWHPPSGVKAVNFSDNFLLLASDKGLLGEAANGLRDALVSAPGGSFKLVLKGEGSLNGGLLFLGHEMQIKAGGLRTCPSFAAMEAMYGTLDRIEVKLGKMAYWCAKPSQTFFDAVSLLVRFIALVRGWRAAYRECDDLDEFLGPFDDQAVKWMGDLGVSAEEINLQISSEMTEEPDLY